MIKNKVDKKEDQNITNEKGTLIYFVDGMVLTPVSPKIKKVNKYIAKSSLDKIINGEPYLSKYYQL